MSRLGIEEPSERLEILYNELLPVVYSFCRARLPEHDAEDVTADVFRAAAERLDSEPDAELATAWFLTAARNRIIDRWRRHERWERRMAVLATEAAHGAERATPSGDRVFSALDRISADHRAVLILHYVEGRPIREIAGQLQRTPVAIESLLARARRSLLKAYEQEDR